MLLSQANWCDYVNRKKIALRFPVFPLSSSGGEGWGEEAF